MPSLSSLFMNIIIESLFVKRNAYYGMANPCVTEINIADM